MSNDLISVCLTTRHRPALLLESVRSVLAQSYRPLEIVIGDNSENDESERALRGLALPAGVSLVYHRHQPAGNLIENTNWTFRQARGSRLALMHDDDLFCDGGLDALAAAWDAATDPAAVYGLSYQIYSNGEVNEDETELVNRVQLRTPPYVGRQRSNLLAGLVQQFPVNGYLVDADLTKRLMWRPHGVVGLWVDVDFGIRLAQAAADRSFVLIDRYVSRTRMSSDRVSSTRTSDFGALQFLEQVLALEVPADCRPSRDALLGRLTRMGVVEAARSGQRRRALGLLRSECYPYSWVHPATLYRLAYIASPRAVQLCNRLLRGLPQ